MALSIIHWLSLAGAIGQSLASPIVTDLSPRRIGYGGGAVTINGEGFSEDVFNQFDPVLGNKVWFANEFVSVVCQTPINWNFLLENPQDPSTTKIVCDLPPRVGLQGSDWFSLILKVDGVEVENSKAIEYKNSYSPKIREVVPKYGRPGDKITINGRLFTKEYGNANFGDQGTVENRKEESITAVMVGSRECELTDDLGNLYGLSLTDGDEGSLVCVPGGTFIGPLNATVFVSGKYGKSRIDGAYSVNSKGQLFVYHTLPEITSVSPNVGASSGGTHVTIQGNSFDAFPGKTQVMLGSTPCDIVSITNSELTCSTPAEGDVTGANVGGRGLLYEIWTETEDATIDDTSASDYNSMTMDGSTVEGPYFNETNGFTARLSGYFVAPYTGNISFYLLSSDAATLYLSSDSDPANKAMIVENSGEKTSAKPGQPHSDPVMMTEGEFYYIEAVHVQAAGSDEENFLQISLWEHETIYHESQTSKARDEYQYLYMEYEREFETQRVTFTGMDPSTEVTFTHVGKKAKAAVGVGSDAGWNETFTDMLTYSCEYSTGARHTLEQDYEDPDKHLPGAGGYMQDAVQAYCGARAVENQGRITHSYSDDDKEVDAKKFPWLCFATKGLSYTGRISLLVLWEDQNENDRRDWVNINDVWAPSDDWSHQCLNMKEAVTNPNITWFAEQMDSKSDIDIQDIVLATEPVGKYYMDDVTISNNEVSIERSSPSLKDDNVMVNTVAVTPADAADSYDITITPWTCNVIEDDLELFGIMDADIVGLDTSGMDGLAAYEAKAEYLRTSDSVVFSSSAWGAGTVSIERITRGTRAMSGTFTISYKDQTIELPPYPTEKSLAPALEAFGMVGVETVYSSGRNKCYNTKLKIKFDTSLGGDVPLMVVDSSNLVLENNGLDTKFEIQAGGDGGLMVDGPGGDFFRMPASQPTLSVTIEGFVASCAAPDCSFSHDSSLTPSLDSVSSAVVDGSVELTITGTGFTTDSSDFVVSVGELDCVVSAASSTEITCTLEAGAAGVYDVAVVVKSRGVAEQPGSGQLTHEVSLEIFSNSPTEGSLGGGTTITVSGSGFPATMDGWDGASVTISGSDCKVISTSFGEFQCVTSAAVGGARRKRAAAEISIVIGSSSATGGSFNYDASLTPAVTAISPSTSSPLGGDVLTIDGSAFGANWGKVLLGENECTVLTWFPTQITCTLPSNAHGDYPVHVSVPGNGYADVTTVDPVSYNFVVTDMTPRKGSSLGGTKVKLTGSGFGDCTDITVSIGDMMGCEIDACTDTEIVCMTQKTSKVHQVSNGGRHPVYGPGYVWAPKEVVVQPGDTVDWIWNLQVASEDTGISVQQTASSTENEWDGIGFKSEKSAKGRMQQVFDAPGTYYFSSQPVFGDDLFMKGVVKVESATEDSTAALSVMMGDIPAAQQVVADTGSVDFGDCVLEAPSDCATDPSSSDSFMFTAAVCLTPVVTSVEISNGAQNMSAMPVEGFNGAELTITGSGFSENSCQNEVSIGENGKCTITSATASSIICEVDGSGSPPFESLKAGKINVNVLNAGSAVMEVTDPNTAKFNLVPKIDTVNTNSGSWAGGNLFILSGSGLVPFGGEATVFVTFGEAPYSMGCTIVEVAFDYISCMVPDFSTYKSGLSTKQVPVTVNLGYDQVEPFLENSARNGGGNITYTYDDALTASADSMSPSTVSSSEDVVIEGSNFGDSVKVYLRTKTISMTRRRRSLPTLPVLEHNIEKRSTDFWNMFAGEQPKWKCLHGVACDHDSISSMSTVTERYRREADPNFWRYEALANEDDMSTLFEVCMTDSNKCNHMIRKRSVSASRSKRAANEEELLEMALMSEGTYEATVTAVTDTSVTFTAPALPAGDYDVIVNVDGQGNALSSVGSLTSSMAVSAISPDTGSVNGGQTITIAGSGFCEQAGATTVTVGGSDCSVQSVTPGAIVCDTPAGADGSADVEIMSCKVSATSSYNYATASSPEITSFSPTTSSGPTSLSFTGSNFGSSPTVMVGSTECTVSASTDSTVSCDLVGLPGGDYTVTVHNADLGLSNEETFTSTLDIVSVTPASGSFGGGSLLTISGTGFDSTDGVAVTICDNVCETVSVTTAQIECLTPENDGTGATEVCDVVVTQSSGSADSASAFTYDRALTPTVASIDPVRGGTGGGTLITITGTGFASSGNKVMIDGSVCDIASEGVTEITCYTNSHNGAIEAPVIVEVPDQGYAAYDDVAAATFYYIDRWSSIWTWGGTGTPLEGEFIVITEGQTILLDESTPILAFLLIKGGKLMFDRENAEIELQSKYILLVEDGVLEIGTEEEPYDSKAIITMHGNTRCTEMPVFGCKVIGVRNGTLDFHGEYVPVTWTHLAATAAAGDTEITLKQPVTWKVGDHIALATTSDRSSMKENEEHYIADISSDGYTITLQEPLKYQHISIEQTFGDRVVESRGEVALLTRNILIRGNYNEEFLEVLPACEEEFDSGAAFSDAAQTCFSGKFGEELGSDEMGAIIIISPKYKDQNLVAARIEYVEFTNVGQAFRVGRYPIHFHLPGNMSTSYIRGNAVHHSNNRACTLHDVSNLVVEHNVAYNIKGLSFFLEDGVEEYNTLQYNLAVFTRMSNSLLNPDINPASFWIVNPNNKFRHNSCAGGTHFCFWLRPAKFPDGPSWTRKYCPNKVNFDEFHNNTAHSMGWYGFWIFGQSNHATYDPHTGDVSQGYCNGQRTQARIGSFTTWNNKRGFEIVSGANIRLENQTHMDHDFAGFEIFTAKGPYGEEGPGIYNTIIVGHSEISDLTEGKENACTPGAIHGPITGWTLKDVSFYNFDRNCYCMKMKLEESGTTATATRVEGLQFINSPNKVMLDAGEEQGMWFVDVDGSLTGTAGANLVGDSPVNPPTCIPDTTSELGEANLGGHTGSVCPGDIVFHRMQVVGTSSPQSLKYNSILVKNDYGESSRPWGKMLEGWESLLVQEADNVNWISFDGSEHVTNVSYHLSVSGMHEDGGNFVLIGHELYQEPDSFSVIEGQEGNATEALDAYPTYDDNESGEWYFANKTDGNGTEMVYILSDKGPTGWQRKKRAVGEVGTWGADDWHHVDFKVYRCFYDGCLPPPPPTIPAGRPLDFHKWSNASAWEELGYTLPVEGDTVFIPPGAWFVMDIDPPPLRMIFVYGGLEIEDEADHVLDVEIMLIQGGKFQVGTQDEPFTHSFTLLLTGNHYTEDQPLPDGPNLGAKALGIMGFADMHGQDIGTAWTKLAATAAAGDTTLELSEEVTWAAGSEIVISTSSYELHETEKRTIASVSGTTVTLTEALEFEHVSTEASISDGTKFQIRSEVGLLTRNVRIVGNDYNEIADEQFGGRVLVGAFEQDDVEYVGFARFSNVEFAVAGQDGWYDNFDPRYALAFLDTGDSIDSNGAPNAEESYVKKCAFNYNYNSAIGIFGSNNIPVEDNVIYRFINNGILDEGVGNRITGNLVTMGESIKRLKEQSLSIEFYSCINIARGTFTVLSNNVMAGCADGGLFTIGNPCENNYTMFNNEAHGAQHGLHLRSEGIARPDSGCVAFNDFYAWRNWDYGIATKSENSVEFSDMVLVENGAGFLPYGVGPSADAHQFEDKYMTLANSIVVAVTDQYDCALEAEKPDIYKSTMDNGRKWKGRGDWVNGWKSHHTGIIWPIFQSSFGKLKHPWHKALKGASGTNPAMRGILNLSNVTFANFGENCGQRDLVFRTNFGADDVNWPINATDIKYVDVPAENIIYMDEPLLGKINPADCTDFDCDGMKKAIIYDNDGSVAGDGNSGTIIPDSAFEWDGNPARGLGYYRVPKPMITTLDGQKIAYEDKMPNTGIYRDDSCAWNSDWRAYKCQGINHRLMIIESMDRDTKIRRLSPIAMLANPGSEGWIDLVNGPQDFSCCSGYTCAERLSTFFTMVATGLEYEVMFTSIPPQNFRIHMLYNDGGDAVRAKIWFPKQQRLDIYVDGMFMNPNNIDTLQSEYALLPPDDAFIPALTEPNGANYFDPNSGHLYLIVKGPSTIEIKTQPIVVLKLGMTVPIENFFEENVVGNLAGLLGIDPANIRVTNIVREGSTGRKKRSTETVTGVEFEIGPPPSDTLGDFFPEEYTYITPSEYTENPAYTTLSTMGPTTTAWVEPAGYLNYDELQNVQVMLANGFQTGSLGAELGLNVTGLTMEEPLIPPEAPPPYEGPEARAEITELTYAEQLALNNSAALEEYLPKDFDVPEMVAIANDPEDVFEMKVMSEPIKVYVKDSAGKMISALGDESDPWMCSVTVLSGPGGSVMGTTVVPFVDGIATFDDIFVNMGGNDYVLEFGISYPETTITTATSIPFNVGGRPLGLKIDMASILIAQNESFTVSASIWDEALDQAATADVLAMFGWECAASLVNGNLTGTTNISVSMGDGVVMFDDLIVEESGLDYDIKLECENSYTNETISAMTPKFFVHEYPDVGLLRQTTTTFGFKGPLNKVAKILKAFEGTMGTASCKGCPPGTLPAKADKSFDDIVQGEWDECWSPLSEC